MNPSPSTPSRFSILLLLFLSGAAPVLSGCNSVNGSIEQTPVKVVDRPRLPLGSQSAQNSQPDKHIVHLPKDAERDAGVAFEEARHRTLDTSVTVTGEVLANANTQAHVTTPVTGRVTKILVSIGDHASEGKPLLIVRSTDIQQAESDMLQNQQQVRSDLKQALVQIDCDTATAEAQVRLSEKIYKRLKNLVDEKIASQADYQAAETQFYKDQIALSSLRRKREATIALSSEKMKLVTGPAKTKLRLLGVSDEEIDEVNKTQVVDPLVPVLAPEDGVI